MRNRYEAAKGESPTAGGKEETECGSENIGWHAQKIDVESERVFA
jgi:hypothetical protein